MDYFLKRLESISGLTKVHFFLPPKAPVYLFFTIYNMASHKLDYCVLATGILPE